MSDTSRAFFMSISVAIMFGCSEHSHKPAAGNIITKNRSYAIFDRKELDARLWNGELYSIPIALYRAEKKNGEEISVYKADFDARRDRPEGNDTCIYVRCESVGQNEKTYTFFSGYYSKAGAELVWDSDLKEFWVRGWKCRFDSSGKAIGSGVRCQNLEPCTCEVEADEIRVLFCNF